MTDRLRLGVLDIETDDKDAEVVRLEALGARRVAAVKRWIVMEAPSGHRLRVVDPQREDFPSCSCVWSEAMDPRGDPVALHNRGAGLRYP